MRTLETVKALADLLGSQGWKIAIAESCTGGLVSATLTDLAGSSDWFECAYITYSNQAKTACLGVPAALIGTHGAVSEPVARAMAEGAQRNAHVKAAVSITGIAGPSGGSEAKPVGTVCFAWTIAGNSGESTTTCQTKLFEGDRQAVREQAVEYVLRELLLRLKQA